MLLLTERVESAAITIVRQTRLKLPDAIIAATAKVNDLHLVTVDEKLVRTFNSLA
jgi:predicted nucleic acid-binding protein